MADPTLEEQAKAIQELLAKTGKNFSTLGPAVDKLLGPFAALVSATSAGATGMAAYNTALDRLPASMEKLLAVMGPAGDAFKAILGVGMEYVKAVNLQNDELYKSYQVLAKTGLAGEANTDSLLKTAQQFGVVSDTQLPQFSQMLASNSEMLAKFGGSAAQGVKAFGDISENIQRTGVQTQLLNMGMSIESINAGTANYLKIQQMSGGAMQRAGEDQRAYTARMSAGAEDYIKQMDLLSKLTGKSAEAQAKEMEDRLNDERYAIHHRELTMKANAGDLEAAKQLAEENKVLQQTTGDVKKGFQAAFTGYGMQTEEGRKLFMAAPEAFNQAAKGMGVNANKILDTAQGEFGKTLDTFGQLFMAAGNNLTSNVADMIKITNLKGSADERDAAVKDQQKTQIENTNESIKVQTATIQLQREAQKDLQNMIHAGSTATSYFMLKLTEAYKLEGTARLPGAEGFKGMNPAEIEAEKAKLQLQRLSQGVGGPPLDKDKGETEGTRRSRQIQAGMTPMKPTESMIERRAVEELNEIISGPKGIKKAIEGVIDDLTDVVAKGAAAGATEKVKAIGEAAKEQIKQLQEQLKLLKDNIVPRNQQTQNQDLSLAPGVAVPRSFSESALNDLAKGIGAAKNQAYPSVASMKYRTDVNPDLSQQFASMTEEDAKRAMQKFAGLPGQSSDTTMYEAQQKILDRKMDELIDISRASKTYLEKISQQAYA